MYSEVVNGEVLDWSFRKKTGGVKGYNFCIGNLLIAQVFYMSKGRWSSVPWTAKSIGVVEGFNSRYSAAAYGLKVWRFNRVNL